MFSLINKVREGQRESDIIGELSLFRTKLSRGFSKKTIGPITNERNF